MGYNDVLPLSKVKVYLRIDEDFTETDNEICTMRDAALRYIEKQTNHIMFARDIDYYKTELANDITVYDYPINEVPEGKVELKYTLKSKFVTDSITLNIGYENPYDVPSELIQAALEMIKVWYFEAEKQANTTLIPENVKEIISIYKRFIA